MPITTFDTEQLENILRNAHRVAVLGIKPSTRIHRAAHYIPRYLADVGYELVPVPVYYPDATEILGQRVVRSLRDISVPVDVLSVFRKPEDFGAHVDDVLALRPPVVWFQSGLLHREAARRFVDAAITVVHDCIGCRRAAIAPAAVPLEGLCAG